MTERVLILGGSGFVGAALISALLVSGYRPVAASRRPDPPLAGAEAMAVNVLDSSALRAACAQADVVINCISGSALLPRWTSFDDGVRSSAQWLVQRFG